MSKICIPKTEFGQRIQRIRDMMKIVDMDALFVYGDEYRKENLRYVSNYWPIFERGALLLALQGDPIVLCAPEGEMVATEMSVWSDIRLIPDFLCVTVPDSIEYPNARYTNFKALANEMSLKGKLEKLGIVGMDAMSVGLYNSITAAFGCAVEDANNILFEARKTKSENELACLQEAARMADAGIKALVQAEIIGLTELEASTIAESTARRMGAEHIIFSVFGSGERTNTIVGRPTSKIIEDGDMIMCALAVQY